MTKDKAIELRAKNLYVEAVGLTLALYNTPNHAHPLDPEPFLSALGERVETWIKEHPNNDPALIDRYRKLHLSMIQAVENHQQQLYGTPGVEDS